MRSSSKCTNTPSPSCSIAGSQSASRDSGAPFTDSAMSSRSPSVDNGAASKRVKPTGYGNGWTQERVRGFRNHHDIAVYREGELAERGEITLEAAAQITKSRAADLWISMR